MTILHTMQNRGLEPSWKLYLAEGDLYRRHNRYHAAAACYEKALETQEVKNDIILQADCWRGMMNCHDMLMDDLLLTDDLYQLLKCAEESNKLFYKYLAIFVSGKRFHLHGQKDRGYRYCLDALENLKNLEYNNKLWSLRLCYSVLVRLYRGDHLYDKAYEMSLIQEQLARTQSPDDIPGERISDLHNVYAQRASLLAEVGRQHEADEAYEQWEKTKPGNPYDEREIMSYLLLTNKLDEALSTAQRYKDFLYSEGDSINIRMLDALTYESHVYSLMNDYKQASVNYSPMASIAYQLHQLSSKKEMQTRYQSLLEKDRLHSRNMWLSIAILTLIGTAIVVGLYFRFRHNVLQKNKSIQRASSQISAYQNASFKTSHEQEKNQSVPMETEQVTPHQSTEVNQKPVISHKESEIEDVDEMLFVQLDTLVSRNQLFLNPELTRDDLMRLIGVDKNRFGRIMKRYSGMSNVSTYINQKRAYYAANYIKNHPEYTIAAAMNSCGLTNTVTLNRAFKDVFGMTPSEYRQKVLANHSSGGVMA